MKREIHITGTAWICFWLFLIVPALSDITDVLQQILVAVKH